LANPGKTLPNGARETRTAAAMQHQNYLRRRSRAPSPAFVAATCWKPGSPVAFARLRPLALVARLSRAKTSPNKERLS
jgi:hypothetical protein